MKISVIIPAYNCLELLKQTLKALERQDFPVDDFEVIVVDDGSEDGTADYLRNYRGKLQLAPIINVENQGRARSRNAGIRAAKGDLVVFLDADTQPAHRDFLQVHWQAQAKGAQVSVGFRQFHPDLPKTGIMRYLETRGAAKFPQGGDIPGRYFVSCNASVSRSVLLEEDGFEERLRYYGGEDLELGYRLSKRLPVRALPNALGWHQHYRTLEEVMRVTEIFGEKSLPIIAEKHPEILGELSFDNQNISGFRDLLIKLSCNKIVFQTVKALGKFAFMPPFVYNYLIFKSYRSGYLRSIK